MEKEKLKEIVLAISERLFSTTTDLVLYTVFLLGASVGKSPTSRGVYQTFAEADRALAEFNSETLRRTFAYLKRKGLLEVVKEELFYKPVITQAGLKKLRRQLPFYDEKRLWDGRLYLVTYDIPEESKKAREILREFVLKRLGAGLLQESVYLTFYNPREILKNFAEEKAIPGSIIVSDLGKDGAIGEENLSTLVKKIYNLERLEERYREFIEQYQKARPKVSLLALSFDFYSILVDDPQIPFELLPRDWVGKKAYFLFRKLLALKNDKSRGGDSRSSLSGSG